LPNWIRWGSVSLACSAEPTRTWPWTWFVLHPMIKNLNIFDKLSHTTFDRWNGHGACPEWRWRIVRGRRPFLLNREPLSTRLRLLSEKEFTLLSARRKDQPSAIQRTELAPRFRGMSDQDFQTSGVFLLAQKKSRRGS
jgi:hypothetical protein